MKKLICVLVLLSAVSCAKESGGEEAKDTTSVSAMRGTGSDAGVEQRVEGPISTRLKERDNLEELDVKGIPREVPMDTADSAQNKTLGATSHFGSWNLQAMQEARNKRQVLDDETLQRTRVEWERFYDFSLADPSSVASQEAEKRYKSWYEKNHVKRDSHISKKTFPLGYHNRPDRFRRPDPRGSAKTRRPPPKKHRDPSLYHDLLFGGRTSSTDVRSKQTPPASEQN